MIYVVSRHMAARDFILDRGFFGSVILIDHFSKEDLELLKPDDIVVGNLPVQLVASICQTGAKFYALVLDLPLEARGKELTLLDMYKYKARLESYYAERRLQS